MADVHCSKTNQGSLLPIFAAANEMADVLLLCGDLTDYGYPEEARNLVAELAPVKIPILAVLGNHDYESGNAEEVKRILTDARVRVLDGDAVEVLGVGFAGVKGFGGGFGRRTLEPWGEDATKAFVHEAVSEALKLESALARLRTPQRVAVLHYSPIEATVEGEPREIFPFLGSGRLEEPLNRYRRRRRVPRPRPPRRPRRTDQRRHPRLQRRAAGAPADAVRAAAAEDRGGVGARSRSASASRRPRAGATIPQ